MLLGFGARNCWCFKDWLDIDLRLNGYVPEDVSKNRNYATVLGFEGANASGKTSALKVFCFIRDFVCNSFNYPVGDDIPFNTFFFNNDAADFYVEFAIDNDSEYRYEASMTTKKVVSEMLFLIKGGKESLLIKREENVISDNNFYDIESKIILKNNASIVSTLNQYGIKEVGQIYNFFMGVGTNVSFAGLNYDTDYRVEAVSKNYFDNKEALNFTKKLIKKFDTGVEDIRFKTVEDEQKNKKYYPFFFHSNSEKKKGFGFLLESSGTKTLYSYLIDYYYVLEKGGVLVLDEFDINLHHDILPHLIGLFTSSETNKKGAQFIFTSLNPNVMDILGRYRSYLFEKEKGESFAYRLDEPDTNILRNDRSVSGPYRKHLIGGYPRIEA